MSNIVKKETSGIIPKEIANITLEELMSTEGVEFHKKNNILRMKQRIANEIVTVEVRSYDDTNIISQSRTNKSQPNGIDYRATSKRGKNSNRSGQSLGDNSNKHL